MPEKFIPEYKLKTWVCEAARILSARRLIRSDSGSLSVRSGRGEMWVTPEGIHPAMLTPDKLVRVSFAGNRRFFGIATPNVAELSHHIRLYLQSPDIGAAFVLRPVYMELLRSEKKYPEMPSGAVNLELPLCVPAQTHKGLIHEEKFVCWGKDLSSALENADQADFLYHKMMLGTSAIQEQNDPKQALMRQVAQAVTLQLRNQ